MKEGLMGRNQVLTKKVSSITSVAEMTKPSSHVWSQAKQAKRVNMYSELAGTASRSEGR